MTQCIIICEKSLIGTYNQCLAVAEALGEVNKSVIISAGRKSFIKAAWAKLKNPQTFWVWLQKPPLPWPKPDLIAAPLHDRITRKNSVQTVGAPNRVTSDTLEKALKNFPQFSDLNKPRVAVLIGGNSKTHTITPDIIRRLADQLAQYDASFMVTTSRRTGNDNIALLTSLLPKDAYIWNGEGDNPYHAMLGAADHIVVTNDSVSMISDAASTGKPVHLIALNGGSPKFDRFYSELNARNITKPFDGALRIWSYDPLNDAAFVADEIRKRMNL